MKYGALDFHVLQGSTTITFQRNRQVFHYPGTDISDSVDLGRSSTVIATTIIAYTETEMNNILATLVADSELELTYRDMKFKKVRPSDLSVNSPVQGEWNISVTFIALDPVRYSV